MKMVKGDIYVEQYVRNSHCLNTGDDYDFTEYIGLKEVFESFHDMPECITIKQKDKIIVISDKSVLVFKKSED